MAQDVKTALGVAIASVKTFVGVAIASVKTVLGVDNTAGGGGGFAPTDIAGCVLWLSDTGASANTWPDLSGNSNDLTEATNPPSIQTGVLNGKQVRRFDGTNDRLSKAVFSVSQPYTVFIVWKQNNTSNLIPISSISSQVFIFNGNGAANAGGTVGATLTVTNWNVETFIFNDPNGYVYANGSLNASGRPYGGAFNGVQLGCWSNNYWLNGDIAEVVIYSSALGTTDREAVEDYLGTKYGITITH